MPRSRSAPKPAAQAASPRPRPAASPASSPPPPPQQQQSTSWFGSRPAAPPPAQHHAAPSPMQQPSSGGGGGMLSGLMGGVMQGAALGTGSAFAHRAVDGLMGARETKVVHEHADAPPAAPASAPMMQQQAGEGPCGDRIRLFSDCMSQYNGDMGACQPYFDAMQQCKRSYA